MSTMQWGNNPHHITCPKGLNAQSHNYLIEMTTKREIFKKHSSLLNNNHELGNVAKSLWLSLKNKKSLVIKYIFVLKMMC